MSATPVPLCPPQIPHDLTWDRIRALSVGSRWVAAWAMARPICGWTVLTSSRPTRGESTVLGRQCHAVDLHVFLRPKYPHQHAWVHSLSVNMNAVCRPISDYDKQNQFPWEQLLPETDKRCECGRSYYAVNRGRTEHCDTYLDHRCRWWSFVAFHYFVRGVSLRVF
jgi:hypothetical protein